MLPAEMLQSALV